MRMAEGTFEAPQLIGPTDFALSDADTNRKLSKSLRKKSVEVIEDTNAFVLFRTGDARNGNVVLIDKVTDRIDYLAHYSQGRYPFLGPTITQLKLWRRTGSQHVQGLTKRIFFDIFLKRYPAVLSDGQQTADGRGFWSDRMAEAAASGYHVALANLNTQQVMWFDPANETFIEWFDNHQAWGSEQSYNALRYIIAH